MSSKMGPVARLPGGDASTFRILARSLVRELNKRGYGLPHIVALANELIDLGCESSRSSRTPR